MLSKRLHCSRAPECSLRDSLLGLALSCRAKAFGGDLGLSLDAASSLVYMAGITRVKFGYLEKLPYILVHADDQKVAEQCLTEYDSSPLESHLSITSSFLHPSSPLRKHIEVVAAGETCHPDLQFEIDSLALFRITEEDRGATQPCGRVVDSLRPQQVADTGLGFRSVWV